MSNRTSGVFFLRYGTLMLLLSCGFVMRPLSAVEYVVSTTGSDSAAGNAAAPFLTIQKAASLARAGDTVSITGGVYRETVIPTYSGTVGSPIVFRPKAGTGTVVITGADILSGSWTAYAGSAYGGTNGNVGGILSSTPMSWDLNDGSQVFVDGSMVFEARQPVVTDPMALVRYTAQGKPTVVSPTDSSMVINCPALTEPAGTWNGALVSFETYGWGQQTLTVTSSTVGQLIVAAPSFDPQPGEGLRDGDKFTIYRSKKALTTANQWFMDRSASPTVLYIALNSPTTHVVEAKRRKYAFDLINNSHITINNISITAASLRTGQTSTGIVVNGLTASYISHYTRCDNINTFWSVFPTTSTPDLAGILIDGTGNTVINSRFSFSAGHMIMLSGKDHFISNNVFHDIAYANNCGAAITTKISYDYGPEYGLTVTGMDIDHNTVYDTSHAGIILSGSSRSRVHHNLLYHNMLSCRDTAAIYNYGTNADLNQSTGWNRVDNNIIIEPVGPAGQYNPAGHPLPTGGIYLDNQSRNFLLDHNLIIGSNRTLNCGINMGSNLSIAMINNTIISNGVTTINVHGDSSHLFQNNLFSDQLFGGGSSAGFSFFNNIKKQNAWLYVTNGTGQPAGIVFSACQILDVTAFANQFTSVSTCDYRLQPTAPAVGAGRIYTNPTYGTITTANTSGSLDVGAFPYGTAWRTPGSTIGLPAGQPPTFTGGLTIPAATTAQSIIFASIANQKYGVPLILAATATSGLPVTFSVVSGPATISNGILTFTSIGTVVVAANQSGNGIYAVAATEEQRSITVGKAELTVTAFDTTRIVGNANPVFTGTVTGVVGSDNISATYASAATTTTALGTYGPATPEAIIPTIVDPSGRLSNYQVTINKGTLVIAPPPPADGGGGGGSCGFGAGFIVLGLGALMMAMRIRRR